MLVQALVAVLCAAAALAARVDPVEVSPHSRDLQGTTTVKVIGAYAECDGKASTDSFKKIYNVHTSAVAKATAITCGKKKYKKGSAYLYDVAKAFESDTIAIAKAVASTKVTCKGSASKGGHVKGCAYAKASVKDLIKVIVSAHAKAIATVDTKCRKCSGGVELGSKLKASVYAKIVEKIAAYSFSNVCIDGPGYEKDFETCTSTFLAEQFAYAFASAFLETDCYGDAYGSVSTKAKAYAKIITSSKCSKKPPRYY